MATRSGTVRGWLPLGLLVVSLLIAGVAVYRGHVAVKSHRHTTELLLHDYGAVSLWSYAQALTEMLGSSLGPALNRGRVNGAFGDDFQSSPRAAYLMARGAPGCQCGTELVGAYAFAVNVSHGALAAYSPRDDGAAVAWSEVMDSVLHHARRHYESAWPFAIRVGTSPSGVFAIAYSRVITPQRDTIVYGLDLNVEALEALLGRLYAGKELLPPTLTRGLSNNDIVAIAVTTAEGVSLFRSHEETDRSAEAVLPLGERYVGIIASASVLPTAASMMTIGGLPRSQVPWLTLLFVLSVLLALVALSQLRREGQLSALRADFVSSVSHELRTPLAQIRLFLETIRMDRFETPEERSWLFANLDRETTRLSQLVDNVLTFSRAERERPRGALRAVDLGAEVQDVVEGFKPLAARSRTSFTVDAGMPVIAAVDVESIRQALINLLDNAVKYGPSGQNVIVRVAPGASASVRISVQDQGPGVPPSEVDRIWQPFVRGMNAIGTVAVGSGIGLSVVRQVAEQHAGSASVRNVDGGGACFVLELPVAGQTSRRIEGALIAGAAAGPPHATDSGLAARA